MREHISTAAKISFVISNTSCQPLVAAASACREKSRVSSAIELHFSKIMLSFLSS
jgi:hypothetical protein